MHALIEVFTVHWLAGSDRISQDKLLIALTEAITFKVHLILLQKDCAKRCGLAHLKIILLVIQERYMKSVQCF